MMAQYRSLSYDQLHEAVLNALHRLGETAIAGDIAREAETQIVEQGSEQPSALLRRALKDQIWQMVDLGDLEWTLEGPIRLRREPALA